VKELQETSPKYRSRLGEARTDSCSNYPARWLNRIEVFLDVASDECRFFAIGSRQIENFERSRNLFYG